MYDMWGKKEFDVRKNNCNTVRTVRLKDTFLLKDRYTIKYYIKKLSPLRFIARKGG